MEQAIGYIYKISNDLNNNIYLGVTSRDLLVRFNEQCFERESTSEIHRLIKEFGWQHFKIEELEQVPLSGIYTKLNKWRQFYGERLIFDNYSYEIDSSSSSIAVQEAEIIFPDIVTLIQEISSQTRWNFCEEMVNEALQTGSYFLGFHLVKVKAMKCSSIEDRSNWIKLLSDHYKGHHFKWIEKGKNFETISELANYIINNGLYKGTSLHPFEDVISRINRSIKKKNSIESSTEPITIWKIPGNLASTKERNLIMENAESGVIYCPQLNKVFKSHSEAALFMTQNEYWRDVKTKTAKLKIYDMVYNGLPSFRGFTFERYIERK